MAGERERMAARWWRGLALPLLLLLVALGAGGPWPGAAHAGAGAGSGAGRGPHHPRGGQVAPPPPHAHYRPQRPAAPAAAPAPKLTQDEQLLRDKEHIREDLGEWVSRDDTSRMSAEELEFHYFQIHDVDNNTKLDGLEILQAILHTAPHAAAAAAAAAAADAGAEAAAAGAGAGQPGDGGGGGGGGGAEALEAAGAKAGAAVQQEAEPADDLAYFVELIDRVLLEDDLDRDGYLSYVEYVLGRQRDDAQRHAAALQAARARTTRRR